MLLSRRSRALTVVRPLLARACATNSNPEWAEAKESIYASMAPSELYSLISERHAASDGLNRAPSKAFLYLFRGAEKSGLQTDAALAMSAHKMFVSHQRPVPHRHVTALIRACIAASDWDSLEEALTDSRKLQLFFHADFPVLSEAFAGLAGTSEWERLERVHAQLPSMALDGVRKTTDLHASAVTALCEAGEVEAAERTLDAALQMAVGDRRDKHPVLLDTCASLIASQMDSGDVPGAQRTLARVEAHRDGLTGTDTGLPRLLADAARVAAAVAEGGSEQGGVDEGAEDGEAPAAAAAEGEGEGGATGSGEGGAEASALEVALAIAGRVDGAVRTEAVGELSRLGVEVSALPAELAAALTA